MASAVNKPVLIKVGAYSNPPKIIMDENGRVSGFWPDLIQYMADAENWKIKYVPGTWEDGLLRLPEDLENEMKQQAFDFLLAMFPPELHAQLESERIKWQRLQ